VPEGTEENHGKRVIVVGVLTEIPTEHFPNTFIDQLVEQCYIRHLFLFSFFRVWNDKIIFLRLPDCWKKRTFKKMTVGSSTTIQ
jgi:hypothetical protein